MKKLIAATLTIFLLTGCDPVSDMEANIENLTSESLTVEFVSIEVSSNKILQIAPNEIQLFEERYDIGSTFIEPSLVEYDSVVIKNQTGEILKVYKPNDTNKNIFNIDGDWILTKPSKRFFKYEFEIYNEDIE